MRKIIFIHLLNDFSGSPKVLSQVIRAVQSKNIEVALYTGSQTNGFLSNLTPNHCYFHYKRFENRYFTLFSFLISQAILFIKLLKYWRKDVTIYVNTMLPFGAAIAGKMMRKPVIYHIHETTISPPGLKFFLRKVIQFTSQKNIFVSQFVKKLESFEGLTQSVVYNSIPSNLLKETKNHQYSALTNGEFNVLMISSMKAYKGIFEFIELARKMQQNERLNFKLVLNATQDEIDLFFRKMSLPNNLYVFSQQKNMFSFYMTASLVLNLSRIDEWIETFGLTILEAISFGIPVIVPPVGGPAEIVSHGKEGYLISSYEIDVICEKIDLLSKNPDICSELSHNARKRALDFNEEKFNKSILDALQS